jgi:peptidoglycan-associated lipoprotein
MLFLRKRVIFTALLALGLNFYGCTSDEQGIESPVESQNHQAPASPNAGDKSASEFASETVYFTFDSSALDSKAQERLTKISEQMKHSTLNLQLAGHTCDIGTPEYNLALGSRRAESAKNFLVQLGVDGSRLTTISYGEEKPAAEGHTEDARSKNRRVEFTVGQ